MVTIFLSMYVTWFMISLPLPQPFEAEPHFWHILPHLFLWLEPSSYQTLSSSSAWRQFFYRSPRASQSYHRRSFVHSSYNKLNHLLVSRQIMIVSLELTGSEINWVWVKTFINSLVEEIIMQSAGNCLMALDSICRITHWEKAGGGKIKVNCIQRFNYHFGK